MMETSNSHFVACYTARDLILYALSIGFSSYDKKSCCTEQDGSNMCFVYEDHPNFCVVPTFAFTLLFWATQAGQKTTMTSIPAFPPPIMQYMGIIPRECIRHEVVTAPLDNYPILHTFQSISFHNSMPLPRCRDSAVETCVRGRFLSVTPKSIGIFVTTEISVSEPTTNKAFCTMQSTVVVLGLPPTEVRPMMTESIQVQKNTKNFRKILLLQQDYTITFNQALLYRLASGDSNAIHVDGSAIMNKSGRPILHGLCTLGIVARLLLQTFGNHACYLHHLEARFVNPVYIGDTLSFHLWRILEGPSIIADSETQIKFVFVVCNKQTEKEVLNHGMGSFSTTQTHSRL